jgi:hypothetical protein
VIEADKRANEQAEAVGPCFGFCDDLDVSCSAVYEHLLQSVKDLRREGFIAAQSL